MFVCFFVTWGAVGVWTYSNVVLSAAHPRPSVSEMWEKLQGPILSQFVDLATSPPYFASAIVIALAALGAAVMLLRRFRLFVAFVCLLLCTFLPVYGSFSRDGILSARYFLVFLVALATVAGYGLSVLLPCRWPRWAANAVIAAIALSVLVFSNASYHVRYTFQDEYDFLRETLAELPDRCVVSQAELRVAGVGKTDLDCCLFAPGTPLVAAYPHLRFEAYETRAEIEARATQVDCFAFFRSAACEITPTSAQDKSHGDYVTYLDPFCALADTWGEWQTVGETTVSPRSTNQLFPSRAPRVGLYRLIEAGPD